MMRRVISGAAGEEQRPGLVPVRDPALAGVRWRTWNLYDHERGGDTCNGRRAVAPRARRSHRHRGSSIRRRGDGLGGDRAGAPGRPACMGWSARTRRCMRSIPRSASRVRPSGSLDGGGRAGECRRWPTLLREGDRVGGSGCPACRRVFSSVVEKGRAR